MNKTYKKEKKESVLSISIAAIIGFICMAIIIVNFSYTLPKVYWSHSKQSCVKILVIENDKEISYDCYEKSEVLEDSYIRVVVE